MTGADRPRVRVCGDIEAAVVAAAVTGPSLLVPSGGVLCLLAVVAVAGAFPELALHRLAAASGATGPARDRGRGAATRSG